MCSGDGSLVEFAEVRVRSLWRRVGRRAIVVRLGLGWIGRLRVVANV